jgi:hypothetical protein
VGAIPEFQEHGRLRTGDILQVLRIELDDDSYGVIVHCRRRREAIDAPLADLECTHRRSVNYAPVKDYARLACEPSPHREAAPAASVVWAVGAAL